MIENTINPIIWDIPGPLEIRWYGIMYLLGFLAVYYYSKKEIDKGKLHMTTKQLDNLLGLMVVGMIVGARLFYAIFYNPTYFIQNPLDIIAVWKGGLSFHGGALGIVLVMVYYIRKHKLNFWDLADTFIIPLALANAFVRFGNFINAEIYGVVTTLPWGVHFAEIPGVRAAIEGIRHPTQLYAVIYNTVIFITLLFTRRKLKNGQTVGLFFIMYALFRLINEVFKDMPLFYGLKTGQWLTIPLALIGIYLLFRDKFKKKK